MTLAEPLARPTRTRRIGTLYGYAAFHLNLMFSSIEEAQRPEVIARCYDPLLDLAENCLPLGVESTGLTLEIIDNLAPRWIARLKRLIASGRVEFIGSGYAQAIGPLMPWRVVEKNLAHGRRVYRDLLGVEPAIALVNEQAWSGGLVPLYREVGYRALIMDWDDCAAHHPEWNRHWRYHPQIACGTGGGEIGLLWSNTIAFQKLQRLAHGDIGADDYADYVLDHRSPVDRVVALYTNDAECFDFRPGRFGAEEDVGADEWQKLGEAFATLKDRGVQLILPSAALNAAGGANAHQRLVLEAPSNPVPVKKQPKYNLTRWASSGRDDLWANTLCHRAYRALAAREASDDEWRTLCRLWSSDFRTHITQKRWAAFKAELEAFVAGLDQSPQDYLPPLAGEVPREAGGRGQCSAPPRAGTYPPRPFGALPPHAGGDNRTRISHGARLILIETHALRVAFDQRRGLAIDAMGFPHQRALIGSLQHGTIDDIALSADWYTGNAVFEGPGEPKVTDLERCVPDVAIGSDGTVTLTATIASPLGPIRKTVTVPPDIACVEINTAFDWPGWGKGSLRLGHVTLKPQAFDAARLAYRTHNGGRDAETFPLAGRTVDLGAPVSFLISCRAGVGMTQGWLELSDGVNAVRLESDQAVGATIGLVEHKIVHGQTFCRMMLSALEMDETRKPDPSHAFPRVFRTTVSLTKVNAC